MNIDKMRYTSIFASFVLGMTWFSGPGVAAEAEPMFKYFQLETDYADWGSNKREVTWEGSGWYGGDSEKIWVKTEGKWGDGILDEAEIQTLYSRNIAPFWDVQAGIRHDFRPDPTNYLAAAFVGLAPYWFEVDTSLFVSDEGDVSFRGKAENDLLLTQKLILSPYGEVNIFASDVPEQEVGAGIANINTGIKLRYEIKREFAPYVDFNYIGLFGETKSLAEADNKDANDFTVRVGVRFWFN